MNYQTVAHKIKEFLTFKAQIESMNREIEKLEGHPPALEKEVLSWEEAVAYAENKQEHADQLEKLRMGIANRRQIVQNKEQEIGEMLPVKNHYILFKIDMNEAIHTYKIGYFPESGGFKMEKTDEEPLS